MNLDHPEAPPSGSDPAVLAPAPRPAEGRRTRRWIVGILVLLAASVAVMCAQTKGSGAAKAAKTPAQRAIPVVGTAARIGDLNVYQSGLGTVTPLKTVTVRSRVDGELMSVAYGEGQRVRQSDLLAQIDPRPFQVQLHQAEGQLAKDEAALKNAKLDLERYKVLIAEDSVSRQQLDTQAATVTQFEAAIKSDQSQVESAKLNLTYSRITAPISGVVGLRLVDPGNIVHASDQNGLLVITQQQPIAVLFTIAADRLPEVLRQTKAGRKLVVDAWDRDFKTKLATGTLLAIDNQIDQSTGTVKIKALFPNESMSLYPSQFVNARLLVDTIRGTILIPTVALQRSPQATYVYVVKPDSSVEMRTVDIGSAEGDDTSIRKGVAAGEVVVVDGVEKLQPGTKVTLATPATPATPAGANGGRKKA